jgi:hypothetical protein
VILDHAAMPHLPKCELVAEWVHHAEAKLPVFGQIVPKPKGGRPEGGVARAARELPVPGKSPEARRKFIERALRIDGLWPDVKSAVRAAGLEDIQSELLAIAKERSPEAQLAKVQEIVARKTTPRQRKASTSASEESAVNLSEAERLQAELAAAIERQRQLEEELETAAAMASRAPAVDEPMKAPTDLDIPPFLDRRPLSPVDQKALDDIVEAWDRHVQPLWANATSVVRERFRASRI